MNKDLEHLRLLSIFHYVVGGLAGFFACFPLLHFIVGMVLLVVSVADGEPLLAVPGLIFMLLALVIMALGWSLAICLICAAGYLAQRRRYTFCLTTAGISCIFMPFGTVLGVFTLITLTRESVRTLFEGEEASFAATSEASRVASAQSEVSEAPQSESAPRARDLPEDDNSPGEQRERDGQ